MILIFLLATPREGIKSGFGQQVMFKMFGALVRGNTAVTLWCHGISTSATKGKRRKDCSSESDSDSDDSSKYKRRCKKKKGRSLHLKRKPTALKSLLQS